MVEEKSIMAVTAKVTCNLKQEYDTDSAGNKQATIGFVPDYADGRNKEWALYTPHLDLRMSLKGDVADRFHLGGHYTLILESDE